MSKHLDEKNDEVLTEEQLLELQDAFNDVHHALQEMTKAYVQFSMAYVKVFEHINEPEPDPNQLVLDL